MADKLRIVMVYCGIFVFGLFKVALTATDEITEDELANIKTDTYTVGDPRRCMTGTKAPTLRFEVIPGGGWDNLRNREMGMIMALNYSLCRTTDDGKFLVPDGVFTIPRKSSEVETFAELIEHWDNFTSTLSRSVNVHAGLNLGIVKVSGKFSDEYESVKSRQHFDKSVTTRVQARYVQYTANIHPNMVLDDDFEARLRKIAAHLTLNLTNLARYESQLLVRDYGTHVITSIDAGAALVQRDEVNATYVKKYDSQKHTIEVSASASFFGIFDFGTDYTRTTSQQHLDEYLKQRTASKILTYGGPVFQPKNFTADKWSGSLQNDLVALDRAGDPIYYVISEVTLPQVPRSIVYDTYDYVKEAVELYYEHNTHRGCTKEDAPNFSYQANIDDGSCNPQKTNFTFGGVYQTCSGPYVKLCNGMTQKNPQTGDYSCPQGYEAVPLQSWSKSVCIPYLYFFHRCYISASYTAYWCAATGEVAANSGFLFGGLYTSKVANVKTQSHSCPVEFYPLKLLTDLIICVSDDYELGYRYSLPFAGFFTCHVGNPLAMKEKSDLLQSSGKQSMLTSFMMKSGMDNYPKSCPEGYSQHLAVVDNGCCIHYCIKAGALSEQGLPLVQRPPFMEPPRDKMAEIEDNTAVLDDNRTFWTNMDAASKVVPSFMAAHGMPDPMTTVATAGSYQTYGQGSGSGGRLSGGGIAAVSVSATLVCVAVGALIIFSKRRRRQMYREPDPWSGPSESRIINSGAARSYSRMDDLPVSVETRT